MLSDDSAREYIFGRGGSLEFPFNVAVKTGTSQAYHDNWTVGYTRDVTIGVWVGNFDRTPLKSSTGVTGAAPIFHAVMLAATCGAYTAQRNSMPGRSPRRPTVWSSARCARLSGMPANPWCPARQRERLPAGGRPAVQLASSGDDGLFVVWPPVYRQWARDNGLQAEPRPAIVKASAAKPHSRPAHPAPRDRLEIVSPPSGATYMIDPTLRREFQTLPLRVVDVSTGTIEWQIAGRILGTSSSEAALDWPLTPGTHRIIAKDERGRIAESVGGGEIAPAARRGAGRRAERSGRWRPREH